MKVKKPTKKKSKKVVAPKNMKLVREASKKSRESLQSFSILAKGSVFSKCKKANLQRVLEEYV